MQEPTPVYQEPVEVTHTSKPVEEPVKETEKPTEAAFVPAPKDAWNEYDDDEDEEDKVEGGFGHWHDCFTEECEFAEVSAFCDEHDSYDEEDEEAEHLIHAVLLEEV